jgi:hypothetical protein
MIDQRRSCCTSEKNQYREADACKLRLAPQVGDSIHLHLEAPQISGQLVIGSERQLVDLPVPLGPGCLARVGEVEAGYRRAALPTPVRWRPRATWFDLCLVRGTDLRVSRTAEAVVLRWYTDSMPTHHPRIQVTEDRELAAALRAAAPHLPAGLPRSRQVRELVIAGARHLCGEPLDESRRRELLEQLAQSFDEPEGAGIDWDLLREGKHRAWPVR